MTCKSLMTLKRRNYIRCIIIATFKEYQIRKQAKIDSFFKEVEYGTDKFSSCDNIETSECLLHVRLVLVIAASYRKKPLSQSGLFPTAFPTNNQHLEKKCLYKISLNANHVEDKTVRLMIDTMSKEADVTGIDTMLLNLSAEHTPLMVAVSKGANEKIKSFLAKQTALRAIDGLTSR